MASRSNRDWDPMADDFNNSNYDPQYPDDNTSDFVKLDHCRLYITNVPKALNEEGLRAAFAKFGTLVEVFLSKDPNKRYAIVGYETSGEARHAMMKLNKTEPLKLNISVAHEKKRDTNRNTGRGTRERDSGNASTREKNHRDSDETTSFSSRWKNNSTRKTEEMANGVSFDPVDDVMAGVDDSLITDVMDPELQLELERLQFQRLKLQQEQLACKQRMLVKQAERRQMSLTQSNSRCVMPDGKIILKNVPETNADRHDGDNFATGAGDSKEHECVACASIYNREPGGSNESNDSTPTTCKGIGEVSYKTRTEQKDTSHNPKKKETPKNSEYKHDLKTDVVSKKSSKTTDLASKKSSCIDSSKRNLELVRDKLCKHKSDINYDLKYSDFYCDNEEEDETNRLVMMRNSDYTDIVEDQLKIVVALAGYPKSKMKLRQMQMFQRCLNDVMDMQDKAGLLRKTPCFLDYYLNRGAIVCICKDMDTRDWMVRVSPGLQERMSVNLILLKAKIKRLCLAILKTRDPCWRVTAQDHFKMLQYFNPTLKTELWKIYAQKFIDDVEVTSVLIDRVSGELIRGPNFINVFDYNETEFELTGYSEIYYECLLSDSDEDLSSVASRVKLLEEIKSATVTPQARSAVSVQKLSPLEQKRETSSPNAQEKHETVETQETADDRAEFEKSLSTIHNKIRDEAINWSGETNYSYRELEKQYQSKDEYGNEENKNNSFSGIAVSDKSESIFESNDNLTMSRNGNLNIDSNRGIAYHRRTNYLHVEQELKIAIVLEGYPQDKLEGTHIRRLKHLFKEYVHKDMKNQRFANLIIPKFQDIYLSNGAVIYICDSLETKDYLIEILPKFVNATGLKLTFRDIKNLVRYTRIVMRLSKEHAHVESHEILLKLQAVYPGLKPNCWKYYSDVAGKQKRQFGVDPESLEVIKSPNFDPMYEGEKLSFRIIDRQKRDVSFEEPTSIEANMDNLQARRQREIVFKNMYVPIDPAIMSSSLTRIRTNHYSDIIDDDYKLYVGPNDYPESQIDEVLFPTIKRTIETVVFNSLQSGELSEDNVPSFHDMYLFDGVIFIICQNLRSRYWIEDHIGHVNAMLQLNLKCTEFRGAVGIISMVVKTDKDADEVISILQSQNHRLRTKFWRKISTVKTKTKLDIVLQIDKLSAQLMTSDSFNKYIGNSAVNFKLGHLQSLLKPKVCLEDFSKIHTHKKSPEKPLQKTKSIVSMQGPKDITFDELIKELRREYPSLRVDEWNMIRHREKTNHQVCDLEIDEASAKIIEKEDYKLCVNDSKVFFYTGLPSHKSEDAVEAEKSQIDNQQWNIGESNQDLRKMFLKIPMNIVPDNKEDLNIIFDLLEDKNPGLNTELWQVFYDGHYPSNGKFTVLMDRQSAAVIEGNNFDPTVGGEKLKFLF